MHYRKVAKKFYVTNTRLKKNEKQNNIVICIKHNINLRMYNNILTESMVKGAGKTIGSLAIFGVVALGWYAGEALYECFVKFSKVDKRKTNSVFTQTREYFDPQSETDSGDSNKYKVVLNNLIL